jgi:16S rRNA (guanine966-N2)-methyltransferase
VRIISGIHKGRIINAPANLPARPTTDFAKTGLFNMLSFRFKFENLTVLDLFAGTGNISYEFLSRKCKSVIAVEENMDCFTFIKKTFKELKMENASANRCDVFEYLKNYRDNIADIIFADPPFDLKNYDTLIDIIFENKLLKNNGLFILEHQSKNHFTGNIYFNEERKYGKVTFSFFSKI